ncbi:MAG: peptidoglycan editing factor PgeF [Gammaproteobacteria bacterium]|nr:MAG: peptidoglycan editing factor PgeF [Gammaproteobacteria bacterium]
MTIALLEPAWVLPAGVHACATLRGHGPDPGFDLGGERTAEGLPGAAVLARRERLRAWLGLERIAFLEQVHGVAVHHVASQGRDAALPRADAVVATVPGVACAVLTADCLPVLFCSEDGRCVAAAHAGWRGLAAGVLEATVIAMDARPERISAWLGAAIGQDSFEVGPEVRAAFLERVGTRAGAGDVAACFRAGEDDRWFADLYALARVRLQALGVGSVIGGGFDAFRDASRFFSYRRDGAQTGRQATLIWIEDVVVSRNS